MALPPLPPLLGAARVSPSRMPAVASAVGVAEQEEPPLPFMRRCWDTM
jgi:hypothetical protein